MESGNRDSIEARGRTVDEAIHSALEELGVDREDVDVEILAEGRAGVFGVGSQEARVRVTVLTEEDEYEDEEAPSPGNIRPSVTAVSDDEDEEEEEEYDEEQPGQGEAQAELARET